MERTERALAEALEKREIFFGDKLLPTFVLPFLIEGSELDAWKHHSSALAAMIEKIAHRVLAEPELFRMLRLRPEAQELMRIDPGYRGIAVLSRPDAIIAEDGPVFLEFNCDSPAMMAFSDEVASCLCELEPLANHRERLRTEQMTPRLLETLLECYREYGGSTWPPTIAITDWPGQKTRYEHRLIARQFEAAGYPTLVCDPRAFRRSGKMLEVEGRAVHLVYRRALFTELLDRQTEVEALLGAYRDGSICMVNPLRSYLASSKSLLAYLCEAGETDEDAKCIKRIASTHLLTPERVEALRSGPGRHVLKRAESHGGLHVLLPGLVTDEQWNRALDEAQSDPWIMQEQYPVPKLTMIERKDGRVSRTDKFFNWNPFLFGGRYAGGIARASDTPLINITLGGGLLPTVVCN
jgi:hypothetical protein